MRVMISCESTMKRIVILSMKKKKDASMSIEISLTSDDHGNPRKRKRNDEGNSERKHLSPTSGVAATRFSNGYRSMGTPTVNLEYGTPLAFLSSSPPPPPAAEAEKHLDGALHRRRLNFRTLASLIMALFFFVRMEAASSLPFVTPLPSLAPTLC